MELRELRSFCAAAKLGGITKASHFLALGQPTVSTHIIKLEQELRISLFDRTKRPIRLTTAGLSLVELASPLLDKIDSLMADTLEGERSSRVSVGAVHDLIYHSLVGVVKAYRSQNPHVQLTIRSGGQEEVVEMVSQGEVDLGVVIMPVMGPEFDFQDLFTFERVLITPLGHPLLERGVRSLEEIAKYPIVLFRRASHTRTILESFFRSRGISFEIAVQLDSMDMAKKYVALGLGVSVGPRLAIDTEDYQQIGVISLTDVMPADRGGIVTLKGRVASTPTKRFISALRRGISNRSAVRTLS